MSPLKVLMLGGVLVLPMLALQFSSAQAEDHNSVVPVLILPDVQDGLYYRQEELVARVDHRISLRFDDECTASGYSGAGRIVAGAGPAGHPPFRP